MKENDIAVKVENLTKMYKLYEKPLDRIWEIISPGKKILHKNFYAVKDLSFEVRRGEVLGIVGVNGSGKSTLLKMITGVLTPTSGTVTVNGRIAALLELGAGFNPEFTGIENIYLQGSIMGYSREEMSQKLEEIISFADIGDFIDQPVKTYSSGMFVRLAFSVNSCIAPDVLIVDEALSVGDFYFVQKCYQKIEEIIKKGTAVIFVTHNMADMVKFCKQAILLSKGKCLFKDDPVFIMQKYLSMQRGLSEYSNEGENIEESLPEHCFEGYGKTISNWPKIELFQDVNPVYIEGNGCVLCKGIALLDEKGQSSKIFSVGDTAYFYYWYEVVKDMDIPIFGLDIMDSKNNIIHGKHSLHCGMSISGRIPKGTILQCRQTIQLNISPGEYTTVIGMSMLKDEYYQMADLMSYSALTGKMERVISVSKSLLFQVIPHRDGLPITFHGISDLPGSCEMQAIAKVENEEM